MSWLLMPEMTGPGEPPPPSGTVATTLVAAEYVEPSVVKTLQQ